MNNKEKLKIAAVMTGLAALLAMSVYSGWKYPELFIMPIDGQYITPYIGGSSKINIQYICHMDPRPFQPFTDKFWCIA
jgi:hypothetical protein